MRYAPSREIIKKDLGTWALNPRIHVLRETLPTRNRHNPRWGLERALSRKMSEAVQNQLNAELNHGRTVNGNRKIQSLAALWLYDVRKS